jgi:hypothetical protein
LRGKAHSEDIKARAKALLLAGESVGHIARQLNLPKQTVSDVKAHLSPEEVGQLRTKKGEAANDLVMDYLESNLDTLRAQAEVAGDRSYLERQSADKLAKLHGVLADRAFRILEAVSRPQSMSEQRTEVKVITPRTDEERADRILEILASAKAGRDAAQ